MQTNQLIKGSGQKPLQVNPSKDLSGDIYLSHREFVGNVQAQYTNPGATLTSATTVQSGYAVSQYYINAALYDTFPWLSQVAQNFSMYEFIGLIFEYRPTSGEYGNTNSNALGKVVMATQYDPDAPAFGSTVQMENYDYATACKPSEHMLHGVETKSSQRFSNMLYTRNGASTKDRILTDLGLFQIATEGVPLTAPSGLLQGASTTVNIGELWVTYRVRLSRANLFGSYLSNNVQADIFYSAGTAGGSFVDNTSAQLASLGWGSSFTAVAGAMASKTTNSIGCTVTNTDRQTLTLTFPVTVNSGVYRVEVFSALGGAATTGWWVKPNPASTPSQLQNCSQVAPKGMISTSAGINVSPFTSSANANNERAMVFYVQVAAPGLLVASVAFSLNASVAVSSVTSVVVAQMPSTILN